MDLVLRGRGRRGRRGRLERAKVFDCGAAWQAARDPEGTPFTGASGGLPTRRRNPSCPTVASVRGGPAPAWRAPRAGFRRRAPDAGWIRHACADPGPGSIPESSALTGSRNRGEVLRARGGDGFREPIEPALRVGEIAE